MARQFQPGQSARLFVYDLESAQSRLVYESDELLFEAPNWTPDGDELVINGGGRLFSVPADAEPGTAALAEIAMGGVPEINNDHLVTADGTQVYVSSQDRHIYAVPIAGGSGTRLTHDRGEMHQYLHGISADGTTLAYTGIFYEDGTHRNNLYALPLGGEDRNLTDDEPIDDGPEFAVGPDGEEWLYFNSERASTREGHAQLFRMRPDGSDLTQLTADERVNWFPHVSPDGEHLVYVSYPAGTVGHPENIPDVRLRLTTPAGGTGRDLVTLFGGQGTMNVPSWSPDSTRFAYVTYTEPTV